MKEVINYPKKRVMVLSNQALGGKNNYWNNFYKSDISKSLVGHSKFAEFALMALKKTFYADSMSKVITLLDIGCGNGRDLYYLRENGIDAHGIDLNSCDNSIYITHGNALNISETYDVYYLRFFVHTLEESELDDLLDNILYLMHKESYIFIETRSSKTITDTEKSETNFRSKIGEEHFRMLYSIDYLSDKIKKNFNINYSTEDKSLAPFRGEDPYVIRMILSKK